MSFSAVGSDCLPLILLFLGKIAPFLSRLAETSRMLSSSCRQHYCRHCGVIFAPRAPRVFNNGRVAHKQTCSFPDELDPFRFLYTELEWKHSFVAGGWAAFLHFREHRLHDNPWRKGGVISQRDLDVFYCLGASILRMYQEWQRGTGRIHISSVEKAPSVWEDEKGRYNTADTASTKVRVVRAEKSTSKPDFVKRFFNEEDVHSLIQNEGSVMVDLVGSHTHRGGPMDVLNAFDIGPCRVGFRFAKGERVWILHADHTNQMNDSIETPKAISYPELSTRKFKIADDLKRQVERREKYIARGYETLRCPCFAMSSSDVRTSAGDQISSQKKPKTDFLNVFL
jgi:hypothetical protein